MADNHPGCSDVWLAAGVRTPFAKVDGALSRYGPIELSVPVVRAMIDELGGAHQEAVPSSASARTADRAVWLYSRQVDFGHRQGARNVQLPKGP
jgi:hypothetical protein